MGGFKNLTDTQKKWLSTLIGPCSILHIIPIEEINEMNKNFGVWPDYEEMEACIGFCRSVLHNGEYGTFSDHKKLNAIREVYLIHKKK